MGQPKDCIGAHGGRFARDLFDLVNGETPPDLAMQRRLADIALQKRQKGLQILAVHNAEQQVRRHSKGLDTGLAALLSRDIWGEGTGLNVEFKAKAILSEVEADWADGMSRFRTKAAGLRQDKEGLRNMVRSLFGQEIEDGNAAKLAKQWEEAADKLRERFNKAGGNIGKIENWGLPQYHDPKRVIQFGTGTAEQKRAQWKDNIRPLLDRQKMTDDLGNPLSDVEFEVALDVAYDRIITEGLVDLRPGATGGKKLGNKRQDHRFLIFKDGEAWLKYHDEFGHQDIYTTMTDHLESMAHDIALLETMGPNPEATFRYLRDMVRKEYAPGGRLEDKNLHNTRLAYLDSLYNVVSGKIGRSPNPMLSDFSNSVRHILVSAKLGGAFLSAMSDVTFQALTRRFNGMKVSNIVTGMLKQMNPANEADRLFAVKLGLGAEAWMNHSMVANRYSDVFGANMASRISDFTMRASLLASWTDAGRKVFGLEFTNLMSDLSGESIEQLAKGGRQQQAFAEALGRYGITPQEWDMFRTLKPMEYKGAKYLRPLDIVEQAEAMGLNERAANDLTAKFLNMIHTETDFAVPTPDARVRAVTTMGQSVGTVPGELARHLFLFKSFPITIILTHLTRGFLTKGINSRAGYAAAMFVGTTVLGALAMQSKEISRGKDPRPMDDPKFWLAAAYQGGGAGIAGDFLFSEESRFGHGPLVTALGPTVALGDDVMKLTLDNIKAGVRGDDANVMSDLTRFARQYTPGSSIWYARLGLEREIFDQLDELADGPKARKAWRRIMRKRAKDYKQGYWWKPGDTAPSRAPDAGNVVE